MQTDGFPILDGEETSTVKLKCHFCKAATATPGGGVTFHLSSKANLKHFCHCIPDFQSTEYKQKLFSDAKSRLTPLTQTNPFVRASYPPLFS